MWVQKGNGDGLHLPGAVCAGGNDGEGSRGAFHGALVTISLSGVASGCGWRPVGTASTWDVGSGLQSLRVRGKVHVCIAGNLVLK